MPEERIKRHIEEVRPVITGLLRHLSEEEQRAHGGILVSIAARARFEGDISQETTQNPEEMRKRLIKHLAGLSGHSGIPNYKLIRALEQQNERT